MSYLSTKVLFYFVAVLLCTKSATSINCYQCSGTDSDDPFQCIEFLDDQDLVPDSCENVYGSQFCVKLVGRFEGGIGTKRYCSPYDLGNYCDYVRQPGDKMEYRTCVYTCTGDGCNSSNSLSAFSIRAMIGSTVILLTLAKMFF